MHVSMYRKAAMLEYVYTRASRVRSQLHLYIYTSMLNLSHCQKLLPSKCPTIATCRRVSLEIKRWLFKAITTHPLMLV